MHPTEPKNAFIAMRGNGWSLGRISNKLGIPKSTLFNWESDVVNRRAINVIKSLQVEKLQENYLPSFEEELRQLSKCLARIERALDKQDFEAMRPEFLLRTALQLRSRLHKFRTDVQPVRTLDEGELPPVHGCISRSQVEIPDLEDNFVSSPSPGGEGDPSLQTKIPKRNEDQNSDQSEHSTSATSTDENGTIIPFSTPSHGGRGEGGSSAQIENPKRDEHHDSSTVEHSTPTTSHSENGTIVPFSQPRPDDSSPALIPAPGHRTEGNLNVPPGTASPRPDDSISLTASFGQSSAGKPPALPLPGGDPGHNRTANPAHRSVSRAVPPPLKVAGNGS